MSNDVPYRHPETGVERILPEGMGEKLGFERIAGYTPPELAEPADDESDETDPAEKAFAELDHAVAQVYGVATNGESVDEKTRSLLEYLAVGLDEHGFGIKEDEPAQGSDSSHADLFAQLEERMEGDDKISKTGREAILKHMKALLPATDTEATTNPKESDLPGKSGETANPGQ